MMGFLDGATPSAIEPAGGDEPGMVCGANGCVPAGRPGDGVWREDNLIDAPSDQGREPDEPRRPKSSRAAAARKRREAAHAAACLLRDFALEGGREPGPDVEAAIRLLCEPSMKRGFTPRGSALFAYMFGVGAKAGTSVTLREAFERTLKGKRDLDKVISRWAATNVAKIRYEFNAASPINSRYVVEELGSAWEDAD
jgi:hypothetical protein